MQKPRGLSKILIVEDEPTLAWILKELLHELGFVEISTAHDLITANAMLNENAPDLAILDVNIGPNPIFPFAEKLRVRQIPIVFSSGHASSSFLPEWITYPILLKPVTKAALVVGLDAVEGDHPLGSADGPAERSGPGQQS